MIDPESQNSDTLYATPSTADFGNQKQSSSGPRLPEFSGENNIYHYLQPALCAIGIVVSCLMFRDHSEYMNGFAFAGMMWLMVPLGYFPLFFIIYCVELIMRHIQGRNNHGQISEHTDDTSFDIDSTNHRIETNKLSFYGHFAQLIAHSVMFLPTLIFFFGSVGQWVQEDTDEGILVFIIVADLILFAILAALEVLMIAVKWPH